MITIYIKKQDDVEEKTDGFARIIKKIRKFIINKFNIIIIRQIDENKKIYLISKINKIGIYKRILKHLKKEETKTEKVQIVLEKELKKYKKYFDDYKVIDGKNIFPCFIEDILKMILNGKNLELQEVFILTNNYNEKNINLIRKLATKVKCVNVITKEIHKYQIIESMMEEWGITIVVSNNKRKSLKKAKIIINLDFSEEQINQYIIYRNAVIINLTQNMLINLKGFEGVIIRDLRYRIK